MEHTDFTSDGSMAFLLLLKEAGVLPDWLEEIPGRDDMQALPAGAYAATDRRLMPLHTKQAAYLSAVSSCVYGYPSEGQWENRLKAACCSYGIEDLVKKAHEVLAPKNYHEKKTSETEKLAYALELQETEDRTGFYYPINNAHEVEASALKMARDREEQKLPGSWFVGAAENLMKAAAAHGVASKYIPEAIQRLAEDRLPSPDELNVQIERRAKYAGFDEASRAFYTKVACAALEGSVSLQEAAHVWELADRKLQVKYSAVVTPPVVAFRSGVPRSYVEKVANSVVPIAGVYVPFNQLVTLSKPLVAVVLPRKSAAAVLTAMDQPDGLKAANCLASLTEAEQVEVLSLLAETASA